MWSSHCNILKIICFVYNVDYNNFLLHFPYNEERDYACVHTDINTGHRKKDPGYI